MLAAADGWINERTENTTRGQVLALHSFLVGLGLVGSQVLLLTIDGDQSGFFPLIAVLINLSVVIVCLMRGEEAPLANSQPDVNIQVPTFNLTVTSYVATIGAFLSGVMSTVLISLVPFYVSEEGVAEDIIALTVGTIFAGRILLQIQCTAIEFS